MFFAAEPKDTAEPIIAAAAFVSNVRSRNVAGRVTAPEETQPLLRAWSLEEPFRIFFPPRL